MKKRQQPTRPCMLLGTAAALLAGLFLFPACTGSLDSPIDPVPDTCFEGVFHDSGNGVHVLVHEFEGALSAAGWIDEPGCWSRLSMSGHVFAEGRASVDVVFYSESNDTVDTGTAIHLTLSDGDPRGNTLSFSIEVACEGPISFEGTREP